MDDRKKKTGRVPEREAATPVGISKTKLMRLMALDQSTSRNVVLKYLQEVAKEYPPESLRAFAQRHYEWMHEHNYSPMTTYSRADLLTRFFDWCEERGVTDLNQVTPSLVEHFQSALARRKRNDGLPLAIKTQIRYLAHICCFFRWCVRRRFLTTNPAGDIEMPRGPGRQLNHDVLSEEEVANVLAVPDTTTSEGLRDRAILEVLYSTGVRRMEIANLTTMSIDRVRGTMTVRRGKGNKDRIVPLGSRALHWIDRYIAEARDKAWAGKVLDDPGYLFIGPNGSGINTDYISKRVGQHLQQAGIDKQGCCHLFRHAMATHLHDRGADLRHIQVMLGHAQLSTTEIYTQISIQKLKEVHSAFHPTANLKPDGEPSEATEKRKLKVVK